MIDELAERIEFLKTLDQRVDPLWQKLWSDLGVSAEIVQEFIEALPRD